MRVVVESVNSDWKRLYLDGDLIAEGHSLSDWDWGKLIRRLGGEFEKRQVQEDA